MEVTHRTRNLKITPRKLRLVARAIKRKNASDALATLPLVNREGARLVAKSLKSAIQLAQDRSLDPATLAVTEVRADEGMKLKRYVPQSHGRAAPLRKRYSHLTLVLAGEAKRRGRAKKAADTATTAAPTDTEPTADAEQATA